MVQDPRALALILEDLRQEMQRWSIRASDTSAAAHYAQRQMQEKVDQTLHSAAVIKERVQDDREVVDESVEIIETVRQQCINGIQDAHSVLEEAQQALSNAQETLRIWQEQLKLALAWLQRAQERLRQALLELQLAKREYENARRDYNNALNKLRNCQNYRDSEGRRRNCSGYKRALVQAEADLDRAELRLNLAIEEVEDAKAEVARAEARVACCRSAVALSEGAVQAAQEGVQNATNGLNAVERALEYAEAAQRLGNQAEDRITEAEQHSEEMMQDARRAAEHADEAQMHCGRAQSLEESAQRLSILARSELNERMDRLHELNRPDGNLSGVPTSSGYRAPTQNASTQSTRPASSTSDVLGDQAYQDKNGNELVIRSHKLGDKSYMIRAYDKSKNPEIPSHARADAACRANLMIEHDGRAKLQDIETQPSYREAGTGGRMLSKVEAIAKSHGATEIYGSAPSDEVVRQWYRNRGYSFRKGGLELFKSLL